MQIHLIIQVYLLSLHPPKTHKNGHFYAKSTIFWCHFLLPMCFPQATFYVFLKWIPGTWIGRSIIFFCRWCKKKMNFENCWKLAIFPVQQISGPYPEATNHIFLSEFFFCINIGLIMMEKHIFNNIAISNPIFWFYENVKISKLTFFGWFSAIANSHFHFFEKSEFYFSCLLPHSALLYGFWKEMDKVIYIFF